MVKKVKRNALLPLSERLALFLLFGWLLILAAKQLLILHWGLEAANGWALLASGIFLFQLLIFWFELPNNISVKTKKLLPRLGAGTWVSLLRILVLSMLAGFLWLPRPDAGLSWLPFILYVFYALADLVDGYAARMTNTVTRLGERLDLVLDGRGLLIASLVAFRFGTVGWWFLLAGLARYIFVVAAWLHTRRGGAFKLRPNHLRRPLAGAQMGFAAAMLAPGLPAAVTFFVSTLSLIPFLGNFVFDWLAASGYLRLKTDNSHSQTWLRVSNFVALFLRFVLASFLVLRLSRSAGDGYFILELLLGLFLLFGFGGRVGVFAFLLETGFKLQVQTAGALDFGILFFGITLLYLGVGDFSLRLLKDGWVMHRWGEKGSG